MMRYIVFTCLCLCSAFWCGAVVVGWARSYVQMDRFYASLPWHYLGSIEFVDGHVSFRAVAHWPGFQRPRWQHAPFVPTDGPQTATGADAPGPNWDRSWDRLSVGVTYEMFAVRADGSGHISTLDGPLPHRMVYLQYPEAVWVPHPLFYSPYLKEYSVSAPCWVAMLVFATLPAIWLAQRGRDALVSKRRRREGLCHRCGYDLRESPERCPECGTPAASKRLASKGGRNAASRDS